MGTPDFAVPTLAEIVGRGHEVAAVYTRAPKPGRPRHGAASHRRSQQAARALRASGAARPRRCATPRRRQIFRGARRRRRRRRRLWPDPAEAHSRCAVPLGCFNLHASLLPRWRGAAPINRAIMAGDAESGVMVMRMEEGLDTGPSRWPSASPIGADMTAGELHDALVAARRRPDGARACRAGARHACASRRSRQTASPMRRRSTRRETRIDWRKPWTAGARPHPRAVAVSRRLVRAGRRRARAKVLRTTRGDGRGAPGTVLDDQLTVACGEGAVRLARIAARRQAAP